jgi:hypothetical protein
MLNKSESLEVTQINENGKPAVEVAKVWFTGDRNVVAKISGFTMKGNDSRCDRGELPPPVTIHRFTIGND